MASLEKNIFEHISLMAQEQIELEFSKNELQQLQMMPNRIHRCNNKIMQMNKELKQEKLN